MATILQDLARFLTAYKVSCKMCQILAGLNYKFLARPFCIHMLLLKLYMLQGSFWVTILWKQRYTQRQRLSCIISMCVYPLAWKVERQPSSCPSIYLYPFNSSSIKFNITTIATIIIAYLTIIAQCALSGVYRLPVGSLSHLRSYAHSPKCPLFGEPLYI